MKRSGLGLGILAALGAGAAWKLGRMTLRATIPIAKR
jgi:hypothetical protein